MEANGADVTHRHGLVESRMRGNPHVRFGGRAEETDPPKGGHRASARSNHLAATAAATAGASLREIRARMGHASSEASLRYLQASARRDAHISDEIGRRIDEDLRGA